jgi:putative flippase GtrA
VRGRGFGISASDLGRIYGRFERAVPDGCFGGLGLGLWLARQVALAHGGKAEVESELDRGSTCTVELPRGMVLRAVQASWTARRRGSDSRNMFGCILRCATASLAGVAFEYGLLLLLVSTLHLHYLVGSVVAGAAYFAINFTVNRFWAFAAQRGRIGTQLGKHGAVTAVGMGVGNALLWLFVGKVGLPYQLGWLCAGPVSFLLWTFPMHRRYTFRAAPVSA